MGYIKGLFFGGVVIVLLLIVGSVLSPIAISTNSAVDTTGFIPLTVIAVRFLPYAFWAFVGMIVIFTALRASGGR